MRNRTRCYAAWLLTVAFAAAGALSPAQAATYYVDSSSGSDGAAGDAQHPWATLQHAADQVAPDDSVIVRAGSYSGMELTTSGTAGSEIHFLADPGANVTGRLNLEGASYIEIAGFTITGGNPSGVRAVECEFVTIRNNRSYQNQNWGIFTGFCDDLLIENNECSESANEHGIYVSNSGDRPVVRGNVLWGNPGNGLHMNGDQYTTSSAGKPSEGVISNALVEGNVIYDNGDPGGGSGINCDGVQDSVIRNNLIYTTHASGISLYQIDGGEPAHRNLVINNTVLVASDGRWALNIQNGSQDNTVLNNIFLSEHASRGAIDLCATCLTGFTSDHNLVKDRFSFDDTWYSLAEWRTQTGQDAHSLISDPATVFEDVSGDDYHLDANSPAIDQGTATSAPAVDLEGQARPVGAGVDIGAYEYCTGAGCNVTPGPDAGVVTPDAATSSDAGLPDPDAGTNHEDGGAVDPDASTPGTDGGSDDGDGDGGCGCRTSSTGTPALWLGLMGLGLAWRRRRR